MSLFGNGLYIRPEHRKVGWPVAFCFDGRCLVHEWMSRDSHLLGNLWSERTLDWCRLISTIASTRDGRDRWLAGVLLIVAWLLIGRAFCVRTYGQTLLNCHLVAYTIILFIHVVWTAYNYSHNSRVLASFFSSYFYTRVQIRWRLCDASSILISGLGSLVRLGLQTESQLWSVEATATSLAYSTQ